MFPKGLISRNASKQQTLALSIAVLFALPPDAVGGGDMPSQAGTIGGRGPLVDCRSDVNQDGAVDIEDLLIFLRDWHGTDPAPLSTPTPSETNPPSITPTPTEWTCVPEYAWLQRNLPETCQGETPFEVQFTFQGGSALITDVFETVPAGWVILSPTPSDQIGNTYHWDYQIHSYLILPPVDAASGPYSFEGSTTSYHWCNGNVARPITGDHLITCLSPPPTPTPTATCPCSFPDLVPLSMFIDFEPDHDCGQVSGALGTYATVSNMSSVPAGTFVIRVNEAEAVMQGVAGDSAATVWVPAIPDLGDATMSVDVYEQIHEDNESNNQLFAVLPIPDAPWTCTQTPTPLLTPTPTPTSERGFLIPQIEVSPNPAVGGEIVTLDGTGSTGIIHSFEWEFVGETYGAVLQNATSSSAHFSAPSLGAVATMTVQLTVHGVCCSPPDLNAEASTTIDVVVIPAARR